MAKHAASRRRSRRRRKAVRILFCLMSVVLLIVGSAVLWQHRSDIRQRLSSIDISTEASASRPDVSSEPGGTDINGSPHSDRKKHILADVPTIAQQPAYPTGCESVSAVIAMRYAGSDISVDDFIDRYLDKGDFYTENGELNDPDPYTHFVGSPRSASAYGCMAPVIEKAMHAYYEGVTEKKRVVNATGTELSALCRRYIDRGIPCLVWVSLDMAEPRYSTRWILPNGESYQWLSNEHCMVLMGYDTDSYYFSDPNRGAIVSFDRTLCETRYSAFGKQALAITD